MTLQTMIIKFGKQFDKDCGNMSGFDLEAEGFVKTWAYLTGDEDRCYWEFDIVHEQSGIDSHVQLPWSTSVDVLETQLRRELDGLKFILDGYEA